MSLCQKINSDVILALKQKDAAKVTTLRMLVSGVKNQEIALRRPLTDAEVLKVVRQEVKKRKDSITAYQSASRPELVEKEQAELNWLKGYLPQELSEQEVKQRVLAIQKQTGLTQFGPLMGKVMAEIGSQADGKLVQQLVKEIC